MGHYLGSIFGSMVFYAGGACSGSALPLGRAFGERREGETLKKDGEELPVPDPKIFEAIFNGGGLGIGVIDLNGRFRYVNRAWADMLGYSPEELLTKTIWEVSHASDVLTSRQKLNEVLSGTIPMYRTEKKYVRKDGSEFWGDVVVTAFPEKETTDCAAIGIVLDVSDKKVLQSELMHLKNLYAGATLVHRLILKQIDMSDLFQEVCRICVAYGGFVGAWVAMLDPETQELSKVASTAADPGLKAMLENVELSADPNVSHGIGSVGESIRGGHPVTINDFIGDPRSEFWRERAIRAKVRSVGSFPLKKQGNVIGSLIVLSDQIGYFHGENLSLLTEMADSVSFAIDDYEREDRLVLAAKVFNEAKEGILITDLSGKIQMVNQEFAEITGFQPDQVVGKTPRILRSGRHGADFFRQMWSSLISTGKWEGELWNKKKNGTIYLQRLSIVGVHDRNGRMGHYIGFLSDITDQREEEEKIRKLAHHDPLTGLPNRILFQDRLEQAILGARRTGRHVGLCYLDLDAFKPINDRFEHQAGDNLLKEVASRFEGILRESDTVCRLGGDEFIVLFPDIESQEDFLSLAEKIRLSIGTPCNLEGIGWVSVTVSVGLALFPVDGEDSSTLLLRSDWAMYQAKKNGKNRIYWQ
jgi:diguanylate cyclase (GGDEF)-like protein/PAS domain S-box-containing protein